VISDPDWDVTEMVDRWMAGESPLKLSRAYKVPESEIRRHLKKQMTHQMQDMRRLRGGPRKSQPSEDDPPKSREWMDQAKCVGYRNHENKFFTEMDVREQKEVCTGVQARQKGRPRRVLGMECPVKAECLEYGIMGPTLARPQVRNPLGEVYGGEHPRVVWQLQKEKKKEGAK
jgi:hypothetical protein